MIKFWNSNSKYFKFALAALLGLFMLLSFGIFYVANKGIGQDVTFNSKPVVTTLTQTFKDGNIVKVSSTKAVLTGFALPATLKTIPEIAFDQKALMQSMLAFSIISIPLLITQLSIGSHKNYRVSLVINIITAVVLIILFALMISMLTNFHNLQALYKARSEKVDSAKKLYNSELEKAFKLYVPTSKHPNAEIKDVEDVFKATVDNTKKVKELSNGVIITLSTPKM